MALSSAASAVLAGLDDLRSEQEEFYRSLHEHPEPSHQEHRTATAIADRLERCGFEVHERIGGTGVVGVLSNGDVARCCCGRGTLVALFQPAEETGDGARAMVEDDLAAVLTTRWREQAAQVVRLSPGAYARRSGIKLSLLDLPLRRDQQLDLVPKELRRDKGDPSDADE